MKITPRLILPFLTLTADIYVQVLAVHLVKFISPQEYIQRKITQPEDDFAILQNSEGSEVHQIRRWIGFWFDRISDPVKYPKVVGPCRLPGPLDYPHTSPNSEREYNRPLFPLDEASRNKVLGRPPPEVVAENIRIATKGKVKTVYELVGWVNSYLFRLYNARQNLAAGEGHENEALKSYNLGLLIPHGDDVLTLLASNFHQPTAGLVVRWGCGPVLYPAQGGFWPEDMLVSQDEQRALAAGALFALGDEEYMARRDHELKNMIRKGGLGGKFYGHTISREQAIQQDLEELPMEGVIGDYQRQLREGPKLAQDEQEIYRQASVCLRKENEAEEREAKQRDADQKKAVETCEKQTVTGTELFGERVQVLNRDILMSEEDWAARYGALVAALRAELYAMAPRDSWSKVESSLEKVVSEAEEMVGEFIMETVKCLVRQSYDEYGYGFHRFVGEEITLIRQKYQPTVLTDAVAARIAYWRWMRMG